MLTRKQIEDRIPRLERAVMRYSGSDIGRALARELYVYRLALAHLDSERARRVGEAVLDAISGIDRLSVIKSMSKCADTLDSWGNHTTSRVLRSVVASLRGEP